MVVVAPGASSTGQRVPGSYGIDAPYVPALLGAGALVCALLAVVGRNVVFAIVAAVFLAETVIYLHTTLRGKFVVWEGLLDSLDLRGDEAVVDVGCGRGAVLIAVARRLPEGIVHGVDVWRSRDQVGNDEERARANAESAGVADRVVLHTADMRSLPLDDASIDVAVSSVAIHSLGEVDDRRRVVDEIIRVLRPSGRVVVADIRGVDEYADRLRTHGFVEVSTRPAGPGFWYSGPWQAARVLTATAPGVVADVTGGS